MTAVLPIIVHSTNVASSENPNRFDLLEKMQANNDFETLIIYRNRNSSQLAHTTSASLRFDADHAIWHEILAKLHVATVQINELSIVRNLYKTLNANVLSVIFMEINSGGLGNYTGLLQNMLSSLRLITTSKILFLLNADDGGDDGVGGVDSNQREYLIALFSYCWKQKFLNVAAFLSNYQVNYKIFNN